MEAKIIVKTMKTKDGKKTFKSFKLVDDNNNGKLVDCVICKTVSKDMLAKIEEKHKCVVIGDISINHNYEYPKAFIRSIDSVE